jgi:hypothetical protein
MARPPRISDEECSFHEPRLTPYRRAISQRSGATAYGARPGATMSDRLREAQDELAKMRAERDADLTLFGDDTDAAVESVTEHAGPVWREKALAAVKAAATANLTLTAVDARYRRGPLHRICGGRGRRLRRGLRRRETCPLLRGPLRRREDHDHLRDPVRRRHRGRRAANLHGGLLADVDGRRGSARQLDRPAVGHGDVAF